MTIEQQQVWLSRAESLFFQYGIKAVTMSDIAIELGISKKTLYQFVESKEDLVSKVIERYINTEILRCGAIEDRAENALDELMQIVEATLQDLQKLSPKIVYELQRYYHAIWDRIFKHHQGFVLDSVLKNLENGIKQGLYRPELKVEIVARIHMAQIFSLFDPSWFPIGKFPIQTVMRENFMLYLFSLVTEEGKKELRAMLAQKEK